jgi:anti-sigma factor RsiW
MSDPKTNDPEELISRALRGNLSREEQQRFEARLAEDNLLRERFEEEQGLERLLQCAPSLPVPSNFTSLALQAVRKDREKTKVATARGWFRFPFVRVGTGLAMVLVAGFFVLQQYRQGEREQMAQSVRAFTEVGKVISSEQTPPTVVFQDFDAIQQLSLPQDADLDLDLLVALQK